MSAFPECLPFFFFFFSRPPWTICSAPRTMNGSFLTCDFVNVVLCWYDLFRWAGVKMPSISSVPILTSVCWQRINHIDSFSSPSVRASSAPFSAKPCLRDSLPGACLYYLLLTYFSLLFLLLTQPKLVSVLLSPQELIFSTFLLESICACWTNFSRR